MITRDRYNQELELIQNAIKSGEIDLSREDKINTAYGILYTENELDPKVVGLDTWNRNDFNQVCLAILQDNTKPIVEHIEVEHNPDLNNNTDSDDTIITD